MENLIVEVSKYLMIILFACYAYECFSAFRSRISTEKRNHIFDRQIFLMYLIHLDAFLVLYTVTDEINLIILYFLQVILVTIVIVNYQLLYPKASRLVTNNMCMLLMVGFIMLTRLSYEKAIRQYAIAICASVITIVIPVLIRKVRSLRRLTWLYAMIGIVGLAAVTIFGSTSYGAKISVTIGGLFSIQPSEFVKILFVFFVAGMLYKNTDFKTVCITTIVAAVHVLILVASRDLGGALIFFVTYLVMLYVATRKLFYFAGGLLVGCIAAVAAYGLFSHVRVRVVAWRDPLSVIDNEGYQICQSLFAIGTGGWFGTGLYQGSPNKIPVVEQDFIFSAISEELGGIFAICLIMVCISCFLMFLNIAMQMKEQFYKLVALGLGTVYAFQVFLTIGGVTKFIPSTGVTLPLVSYGGSSLLATMMLFAVIQGLYILRQDEGENNARKNSERPDTRDNRSKNSTKTGKKKKNTKNQEFAVITYSFLALFICLMGYFSYFQFFKSEEFINNPYNTRQETFAQKIVRGQILTNDGQVLAETVTDSEGNETRRYPYGSIFSHIVGYSTKGKSGIESLANFNLLRSNTAFIDKVGDEMQGEKSPGDNVVTTLDYGLQATAYDALGYYKGAIVVLEPFTGKILAMVSKPDFDPNTIAADWDNLTADDNTDAALLNRATQGLYPPGSTFKILTTLEYIQEHADYENYSYTCTGSYTVGNHTIHCYGNKSHGTQNLRQAFANSCNAFYASLGMELDIDQFGQLCNKMLFNTSLPTDLQASKSSFVLDKSDGSSAIMATSIGQGQTLVTPFHMALLVSAINNDGVLMKPYVLDRVESSDGTLVEQYEPEEYGTLMTTDEAAILKDYMNYVVETGTGKKLSGQSYEAAGKTGSAEYSTGADSSHSWFVGYAHRDDKSDIAIAVIVEKAGVGSEYAVPIAKEVFDAYYNE